MPQKDVWPAYPKKSEKIRKNSENIPARLFAPEST